MKKYIFSVVFLSTALLTSCSLDETPQSKFKESDAFANSTLTYVNSVAKVYSEIGDGIYGGTDAIHCLQEFTSDEAILPGRQGDWVDGGKWQNFFLHNFASSVDTYNNNWKNIYKIIGQCNGSIDQLTPLLTDHPDYKAYVSELRALRAIYYYYAMDLFGQVPVVTSSTQSIKDVKQSNRSEVFDFVVKELTEVLAELAPDQSQKTGKYYGRITQPIAYMCLAKCALNAPVYKTDATAIDSYKAFVGDDKSKACKASETLGANVTAMGKNIMMTVDGTSRNCWETVKYCVDKIAGLGYSLSPNYADNFVTQNQNSNENIFVRPNDDKTYKITDYNLIRSVHYNHASAAGFNGWNGACGTVQAMKVMGYKESDEDPRLRLNYWVEQEYTQQTGKIVDDGVGGPLTYKPLAVKVDFDNNADKHDVKCAGARFKKYEYDPTAAAQGQYNNDLVIWRYGDAVLMKAEAEYRLGNTAAALTLVNQIRSRAHATARTSLTLNDILNERMIELAWEGVRRQDQIRFCTFTQPTTDRYPNVWHNASAGDYNDDTQGYTCVYPIPYEVLNLNRNLHQNPGYTK
ncbi:RagB/SusD family nutrient uptake outer membrane protein [Prevotella histicola]|jgi:putative outer membrane protein|uniref:RagB/SusD family nutrient uptake outer membrane protein n=1 Tax=Prevotella histicola TaxID=470565 RepID=UPI001C5E14AC|nr:RagB/SusD family nutrient uptake outer membrane protein [Prevotella histicola]MBW4775479.1 RagB/SusD family nutrient uptake outer membrane protein [Prevotella histicola]